MLGRRNAFLAAFQARKGKPVITLGLDPGTATTGYGLVESKAGKLYCQDFGCFITSPEFPTEQRLAHLYDQVTELLEAYGPSAVAVERLFFNKNVRTAIAVGQARGVLLLAAARKRLALSEYTPLEVKQAVAGHGAAPKSQVQFMVKAILSLPEPPKPDDAADALAIAICHQNSYGLREKMAGR